MGHYFDNNWQEEKHIFVLEYYGADKIIYIRIYFVFYCSNATRQDNRTHVNCEGIIFRYLMNMEEDSERSFCNHTRQVLHCTLQLNSPNLGQSEINTVT
jgi:hypothetical protein